MIKRFLIIFMALSLLGCAYKSTSEIMNSWKGSHISQVIQSWGPPTQVTEDGAGGKIYIWRPQPITLPDTPASPHLIDVRPLIVEQHNKSYKMFYVRPNGTVYYWRAQ